jgi:hypothetical protein
MLWNDGRHFDVSYFPSEKVPNYLLSLKEMDPSKESRCVGLIPHGQRKISLGKMMRKMQDKRRGKSFYLVFYLVFLKIPTPQFKLN